MGLVFEKISKVPSDMFLLDDADMPVLEEVQGQGGAQRSPLNLGHQVQSPSSSDKKRDRYVTELLRWVLEHGRVPKQTEMQRFSNGGPKIGPWWYETKHHKRCFKLPYSRLISTRLPRGCNELYTEARRLLKADWDKYWRRKRKRALFDSSICPRSKRVKSEMPTPRRRSA